MNGRKKNISRSRKGKSSDRKEKRAGIFAVSTIVASIAIAYSNSMTGTFIFDDLSNIVNNPTIKNIWSFKDIFYAPSGSGLSNRPFVNASFALNYAISGLHTWSYHLFNLLIHIAASLTLFGIVRRTLALERIPEKIRNNSDPLALACTLIWALHPLQTSAVTYIIQRCESLMGLCFLLTLYGAIRGWQSLRPTPWYLVAVFFYFLGVGSKEAIIAVPFIILIYEFLFMQRSPREIARKSAILYAGLTAGTAVLLYPVFGGDSVTVVLGNNPVNPLQYWMTQPEVILHYLRLAFWPHPLSFDYGWPLADPVKAWPYAFLLFLPIGAALWLLYKRSPLALPATAFFLMLAPTSLLPLKDPAVEYRMYLPLAAFAAIVIPYGYAGVLKLFQKSSDNIRAQCLFGAAVLLVAFVLGVSTYSRNKFFMNNFVLWEDTVAISPGNGRAHLNMGVELDRSGRLVEAAGQYEETIRLSAQDGAAHANLGFALYRMGRKQEAVAYYHKALQLNPRNAAAHSNLGIALWDSGQKKDALAELETALQLEPNQPEVLSNLGNLLNGEGQYNKAMAYLQKAIRLRPDFAEAHANLGFALENAGRVDDAVEHYQKALQLNPSFKEVRTTLERLSKR